MREHDGFLGRLEETLSRIPAWVDRRVGEGARLQGGHGRIEAVRREIADARRGIRETGRADLARVRQSLEDLRLDYDVPPQATALTAAELHALRRHLHTTARLMHDLSDLDSPRWSAAHEEYERSWAEVEGAYARSASASP
jgi:hypothetical protein